MATNPVAQAISPFIWGRGGAALTPEQVAREREIAEALIAQGIDTSPVGHWTQGAARMANVLAGKIREGRASRAETEGRSALSERMSGLFGGGSVTAPGQASIAPDLPSALSGAAGRGTLAATIPAGERADYIRQGLVQRGLPGHVADAFLLNFQDESGLDPGINERTPLVPGSRGGYGLYQLTGPRRREYEAFAAQRGVDPSDIDAQLDFLMQEGSGPERAAFERILAAPDTGTAAVEIVNRFLRPAAEHRESRASRYMQAPNTAGAVAANDAMASGQLAMAAPIVAETPEEISAAEMAMADPAFAASMAPPLPQPTMVQDRPIADVAQALTGFNVNPDLPIAGGASGFAPVGTQAPNVTLPASAQFSLPPPQQQIAQSLAQSGGGGQPSMQQLIELASDPWATDAQRGVVQALLQQQMQAQDPMRQLQMQKLEAEIAGMGQPQQTAEMQNLSWRAQQAGLQPGTPEYQNFIMTGGRNDGITVNVGDGAPGLGKLSSDFGYVLDPQTREPVIDPETGLPRAAPIPGSPAWQAQQDAERQREAARTNAANYARTVTQDIGIADDYLGQIEGMAAEDGVIGANLRNTRAGIAGTPENNMKAFVDSALSNVTLDTMNRMRESSPAGATGFGNMSERQMEVIRGVLGNWKPSLPVEDQRMILHRLGNFYLDVQFGSEQERQEAVRDGRMSPVENDAIQELYYPETRDIRGRRINEGGNRTSSGVQWSIE